MDLVKSFTGLFFSFFFFFFNFDTLYRFAAVVNIQKANKFSIKRILFLSRVLQCFWMNKAIVFLLYTMVTKRLWKNYSPSSSSFQCVITTPIQWNKILEPLKLPIAKSVDLQLNRLSKSVLADNFKMLLFLIILFFFIIYLLQENLIYLRYIETLL